MKIILSDACEEKWFICLGECRIRTTWNRLLLEDLSRPIVLSLSLADRTLTFYRIHDTDLSIRFKGVANRQRSEGM